jgi:hypothetical protein
MSEKRTITGRISRHCEIDSHYYGRRRYFENPPPPDQRLLCNIDYAQLELRIIAAGQEIAGLAKEEMMGQDQEGTEVTCVDCKEVFTVSKGEEDFLRGRFGDDFAMPKRCKPCRKTNKERKSQRDGKKRSRTK